LIRDGLQQFIPHLEYTEFDRCGHAPWIEEHVTSRDLDPSILTTLIPGPESRLVTS
jgi:hypothetical protein